MDIKKISDCSFECTCGKTHNSSIKVIEICDDAFNKVGEYISPFLNDGKILVLADSYSYKVAGKKVLDSLKKEGLEYYEYIIEGRAHPNALNAGKIFMKLTEDTSMILGVGSGVINDLSRFVAFRAKIPYAICGTAPSMDGYASKISPMVDGDFKRSFMGGFPSAIICDLEVNSNAPEIMIKAGLGDIIGKVVALADWQLAREKTNEDYCDYCANLIKESYKDCVNSIDGLLKREKKSIEKLSEALILAGVTMGLYNDTRPASGSEHLFAHYWDIDCIKRGVEHPLHGISVTAGTLVSAIIYDILKQEIPKEVVIPEIADIIAVFKRYNGLLKPEDIGVSKELLRESILTAGKMRPRYTILNFAEEKMDMNKLVDMVIERLENI